MRIGSVSLVLVGALTSVAAGKKRGRESFSLWEIGKDSRPLFFFSGRQNVPSLELVPDPFLAPAARGGDRPSRAAVLERGR
jgi:hypothetical protein